MSNILRFLKKWQSLIIFVLAPLLLLPLPILSPHPPAQTAYIMLIMGTYWVSEAIPISVTALLPVIAMPALKIVSSKHICPTYFEDSNMLFIGGLMLAISIEFWNLHKRAALAVLRIVGVQPRWLLLGFMLPTWFMSMWISNTATSAMMLPIVDAVLGQLKIYDQMKKKAVADNDSRDEAVEMDVKTVNNDDTSVSDDVTPISTLDYVQKPENADFAKICKMLTVSVAYSANIGGIATLTGTAPNLVLNNNVEGSFGEGHPFNFLTWMFYALPISLVCVIIAWLWLQILYLGPRNFIKCSKSAGGESDAVKHELDKSYAALGGITYPEISCIVVFTITVLLWFTRQLGDIGWGHWFTTMETVNRTINGTTIEVEIPIRYMADAQPAIGMALLLFILPSFNPFKRRSNSVSTESSEDESQSGVKVDGVNENGEEIPSTLLTWQIVNKRLPWGIVLLLGGGFALAKATRESGLSALIGQQLEPLDTLSVPLLIAIIVYCTTFVTEITSNTATASILLPILFDLSRAIRQNPMKLMLPCTIASSLAFNLPIATPPNAIVFSKGYLTVTDMMKSGFVLTILCGIIVIMGTVTHGTLIFDLEEFPDWANGK